MRQKTLSIELGEGHDDSPTVVLKEGIIAASVPEDKARAAAAATLPDGKVKLPTEMPPVRQFYSLNTLKPRQNGRHFADAIFKCIFLNENVWTSLKISLKFVPNVGINKIPALVQIMAWRRPGDKPLSEPMIVRLPTHICVARPQWVNTLRLRRNGCHFPDDIFMNENICISIKISLKMDPKGPIDNNPALVQIMAWRQPGDKPLTEPMLVSLLMHICVTRPQWVNPLPAKFSLLKQDKHLPILCCQYIVSWLLMSCQRKEPGQQPHDIDYVEPD